MDTRALDVDELAGELDARLPKVTSVEQVEAMVCTCERLEAALGVAGSTILDEPVTARALADFWLRTVQCDAATEAEALAATGLDFAGLAGLARPER